MKSLGRTTVASASASGGTMPAAMTVAMITSEPALVGVAASPAVAKAYAALLTGPPRSKHIIRPRMMPSRIADVPAEPVEPVAQAASSAAASGRPSTTTMRPLAMSVANSGMITTGMQTAQRRSAASSG